MTPSDETLMTAVAAGQLQQLSPLYERYKCQLLGFLVNRLGGDQPTAEDLLQTTFERIIKYRKSWKNSLTFRTWVFTIARNVYRDHCRREGRFPLSDEFDFSSMPETRETTVLLDLNASLATLTDGYREIVELAWKRKLKYAEIAEVVGISEANVKVRMHRACKQLRSNYFKNNRS